MGVCVGPSTSCYLAVQGLEINCFRKALVCLLDFCNSHYTYVNDRFRENRTPRYRSSFCILSTFIIPKTIQWMVGLYMLSKSVFVCLLVVLGACQDPKLNTRSITTPRAEAQSQVQQVASLTTEPTAAIQCIEPEKITYGGDWGYTDYIHRCPVYQFAYGGTESKEWGTLRDPIAITQAPAIIHRLKRIVEDSIRRYAGTEFYQLVHFDRVEMVVPEQLSHFKREGVIGTTLKYCKAKYFFYYEFKPDSVATYHYGVAIDKHNKIISPFKFPKASEYQPIDQTFSYCQLLRIAEQTQPNIKPVGTIRLEYDQQEKRFYWVVSQEIVNQHEGVNHYSQVLIDAADLTKTKKQQGEASIVY